MGQRSRYDTMSEEEEIAICKLHLTSNGYSTTFGLIIAIGFDFWYAYTMW